MTSDQLRSIGHLDQLKKDGTLTPQEYEQFRERVLAKQPVAATSLPVPPSTNEAPEPFITKKQGIGLALVIAFVSVLVWKASDVRSTNQLTADTTQVTVRPIGEVMREDSIREAVTTAERAKTKADAQATVRRLRPALRYQKDEFNGGWFYGKSSPRYTNANGIYAYFNYKDDAVGPGTLRFAVHYYDDSWLFIERYRFLIDGKEYVYIADEVSRDSGDGGMIWEWFDEPINSQSEEIIKAIVKSKTAKVRIVGKDYYDDKVITPAQRADFKRILDMHQALTIVHNS